MQKSDHGRQATTDAARRRSAKRRKVLKGGWLVLGDGTSSIRCFVKDVSATGARVETPEPLDPGAVAGKSGRLKLTLSDGETLDAELVRRTGLELGIRFPNRQRPSLAPPPEPLEQLIEVLETMGVDDVLARIEDLGLDRNAEIAQAAAVFGEAFTTLYARISEKSGPW